MNKKKRKFEVSLTPVDKIPISTHRNKPKEKKIDVEETEYLKNIGRKPKQTTMTANYLQEIYNRNKKEKKK